MSTGNKIWAGIAYTFLAAGVVWAISTGNLFHMSLFSLPLAISLSSGKEWKGKEDEPWE